MDNLKNENVEINTLENDTVETIESTDASEVKIEKPASNIEVNIPDANENSSAGSTNSNVNSININLSQSNNTPEVSEKSKVIARLLCFFLGRLGVHRFYVGKIGTGVLYLFTGGIFGIGALVDFVIILCGNFRDGNDRLIKN